MILDTIDIFLNKIFDNLANDGINVSNSELDHVCYRVKTLERYEEIKNELEQYAQLLLENEIGGRLIAKYKLQKPIIFKEKQISVIELPQPKGSEIDGWEHVEFVIDKDFEDFMNEYSNITFNISGIDKEINADIVLKYKDCAVKFHKQSLEYIIENFEK